MFYFLMINFLSFLLFEFVFFIDIYAGSVKEAEEFDKLPVNESKRLLKILLEKMDLNHDTYIERHELKAWILRSFA